MSRTSLLPGISPSPIDRDVLRALVQAATPVDRMASTPTQYLAAIENGQGQVYRVVVLFGLTEKARFAALMAGLGFESDPSLGSGRGYSTLFSPKRSAP